MKNIVFTFEPKNKLMKPFVLKYPLEKIKRVDTGKASNFLITDNELGNAYKEFLEDCAEKEQTVFRIALNDGCVMYRSERWYMTIE